MVCVKDAHSEVTAKDLEQWFFKIKDYAERLLEGHDRIDWPEKNNCHAEKTG